MDSVTIEDTTKPAYWLNFRFFLSALCIFIVLIISLVIIWRHEIFRKSRNEPQEPSQQEKYNIVYFEDTWKTCYKSIHPRFLLSCRLIAFCVLLGLIISDVVVRGGGVFLYYTVWTFTLVTIYFGFASMLSLYGCCHGSNTMRNGGASFDTRDPEIGNDVSHDRKTGGFVGYTFQILYQTTAGAVTLTDVVYWLILYKGSKLNFLTVCLHSANAVFYLGDLILNNLKFPFFRIAYYMLWTCTFVVFQWILHACSHTKWPYNFLTISSNAAPLWYLGIAVLHVPCFGVISLITKAKECCLIRFHVESYGNV